MGRLYNGKNFHSSGKKVFFMTENKLRTMVFSALFAALIFLGIYIIHIPIPNGYLHFGDGLIYAAASLLPLPAAIAASAVGGALADLLSGFAIYAPITAVVKALMALAVGLIVKDNRFLARLSGGEVTRGGFPAVRLAAVLAGVINVAGYFIAECFLYGAAGAAASLGGNAIQSAAGIAIYLLLLPLLARVMRALRGSE